MSAGSLLGALGGQDAAEALEAGFQWSHSKTHVNVPKAVQKLIIVANRLPLRMRVRGSADTATTGSNAAANVVSSKYIFEWDDDSLLVQAKPGSATSREVVYVGALPFEVAEEDQPVVDAELRQSFGCMPVFLGENLQHNFYRRFCKNTLWPIMHYVLPLQPNGAGRFSAELWNAYLDANRAYANRVCEVLDARNDCVWVHDYHLMVLPSFLRSRFHHVKLGFFMHSPFPSSEIFRSFPERESFLRGLLNVDLIGFHTFDYARHFLSCCTRVLGLKYESSRGALSVEYFGRTVGVRICPTGIQPQRLQNCFSKAETLNRRSELSNALKGTTVLLGVDDIDMFKGIELKLQAFQSMLETHSEWRGKVVLVQIANPARAGGRDIEGLTDEVHRMTKLINDEYGKPGYEPVVLIERQVPLYERVALYNLARAIILTATRDGMNLVPYEYIVCREGPPKPVVSDPIIQDSLNPRSSALVVSEFVGCSPSLSGAIRVNPWNVSDVADSLYEAVSMMEADLKLKHDKHWRHVREHTAQYWASANLSELERITSRLQHNFKCYGIGNDLDFRIVALGSGFSRLHVEETAKEMNAASSRLFIFDYDTTLTPYGTLPLGPSQQVLDALKSLAADPANLVQIISRRSKEVMDMWFSELPNVTLAAEHGAYMKRKNGMMWELTDEKATQLMQRLRSTVLPIMEDFVESTDGAFVDEKEASITWHHGDADPDFGHLQAKELVEQLQNKMLSFDAVVTRGGSDVEVKPTGTSKRKAIERVISKILQPLDFFLLLGNDAENPDMFRGCEQLSNAQAVYPCTVGQPPTCATYYVDSVADVLALKEAAERYAEKNEMLVDSGGRA